MKKRTSLIKHVADGKYGTRYLQVPLFMTASDIVHDHPLLFSDLQAANTPTNRAALIDKKYTEAAQPAGTADGQYPAFVAHGAGVRDSIHASGYDPNKPLEIEAPKESTYEDSTTGETHRWFRDAKVTNGHHRLSVMFKDFPEQPVPFFIKDQAYEDPIRKPSAPETGVQ
jgi:hypothetical protein